ncbi:MAG: acyl-protein synthetase [Verrucomicrobiales bacterium]|nr:acyl-protein synthetase [Verrucomicrobiales bacterium]
MVTVDEILALPKDERLRIMELLWSGLTESDESIDSPSWHDEVLSETAKRVAEGTETPIDFSAAKEILRSERR